MNTATPYARHLLTHKNVTFHRPLQVGEHEAVAYDNSVTGYGRLFWPIPNNSWSDQHLCPQAIGSLLDGGNNPPAQAYPGDDPTCLTLRSPSPLDNQFARSDVPEAARARGYAEAPCGGAAVPNWWTTNGDNAGTLASQQPCTGLWRASGRAFFTPGLAIGTDEHAIVEPTGYQPLGDPTGDSHCELNQVIDPAHPNRTLQTVDCFMFSQKAITVA